MRLHSLALTAFGSFGGTETIDFDQLADAGLFLLHGPTGAGKTTVLDAVSFALFGTVAGVRAAGLGLRSHHASATTPTEVCLEVSLDGRRFRIVRRPRQVRPKRRGEGTVEDAPTATVQELVKGAWVARAARPVEADPYLQELLHMGVNQFHQIVMLPQGDFARFLRANADDRRVVLEELFATHRFTDVERWLRARADVDQAAVGEADAAVREALVAAATVAEAEGYPRESPVADARAWLTDVRAAAAHRTELAGAAEETARAGHTAARAALAEAIAVGERQERMAVARATRARLDEQADRHAADQERRGAALRAAPVLPLVELLTETGIRSQALETEVERARGELAEALPDLATAERAALVERDETLVAELGQLAELTTDELHLDQRERELSEIAAEVAVLDDLQAGLAQERLAIPERRADQRRQLAEASHRAARVDDLRAQLQILTERYDAAVTRDELLVEVAALREARDAAAALELSTHQTWLERYEAQLADRAAALALALEDGHPCPVCGSAEHPAPASASTQASPVSDEQVAAAKAGHDAATARHLDAHHQLSTAEAHLAAVAATAVGLSLDDLATALDDQRAECGRADAAAQVLPVLEAGEAELDRRATALDDEIETAAGRRNALDAGRSSLEGALLADRERVERARAGFATLAERGAHLQAQRELITAAVDALDQRAQADATVLAALEQAETEAVRQGFDGVTEAAAAALTAGVLAELVASIDAHERALAQTDADLSHPELVAAAAAGPVDLVEAQRAAAEADRDLELASIEADAARRADHRLAGLDAEVASHLAELGPRLETAECSRRLADLANGDDRQVEHRMRLSTYVLAARLEQVAAAASERLQRMSNGRYTIVHTDEVTDGRRKGGLGLRVVDAWTSTERETSTLSGGESFFTSLALALGVADVVTAEVGGVAMETMFIDEGFGSLDDDTLQHVMDVLDGLRAGGRSIGIVSHVGDLRTRIPSQLEVVKTATGSRVRTTGVPGAIGGQARPSTAA